jgi:hypothetical protein
MTAIAVRQTAATTPTLVSGSKSQPKPTILIGRLAAALLGVLVAAFFVAALTTTPPAARPQRHTPAVQHPGPPSSEEILSHLHAGSSPG